MLRTQIIALTMVTATFFAPAMAYPNLAQRETTAANVTGSFTKWVAAGPNDSRGPCPGLNTLANHGFLPHDGKAITLPMLIAGIKAGLNVGEDFAKLTGGFALAKLYATPQASFNLADLNKHNVIEHDGSLSRLDHPKDVHTYNQKTFDEVLKFYKGSVNATLSGAAKGRQYRLDQSKLNNPEYVYTAKTALLSMIETVSYLGVLSTPSTMNPPVKFVEIFFKQERLPYAEGWRRSDEESNLKNLVGAAYKAKTFVPTDPLVEEALASIAAGSFPSA